jgi:hypothetical protein
MSNTAPTLSKPATIRRVRYAIQTIVLLFAVTTCCVLAIVLGDRFPHRFDATATREHHLSPRTTDLLASLRGEYELVVTANFSTLDQQAARRTEDVLDNFSRATTNIRTTIIDVSSTRGLADLDGLLNRLVERFRPALESQRKGVEGTLASAGTISGSLVALSADLLSIRETVKEGNPNAESLRQFYTNGGAACRVAAENLDRARGLAQESLGKTIGRTPAPATDDAVVALRKPLSDALTQLGAMGNNLEAVVRSTDEKIVSAATRERTKPSAATTERLRREIGDAVAALDELPRTPISSVLRVMERTSAAIVIGPPGAARMGVTSVELSAIYPPRPPEGAGTAVQIDLRARTEELLAGAVLSLARTDTPIVVFVHGQDRRMAPDFLSVAPIVDRMRLRGVDFAEWAAALDDQLPSFKTLDPHGMRPVVYIVVSMTPTTEQATAFGKLVGATAALLNAGKPMLLCEVPSTMPSMGQKDAMADVLAPLGISVDTGRPLLRQRQGPRGRIVSADLIVTDPGTDHPIARAIHGLALYVPWSLPVRLAEGATGVRPVVAIDNQGKSIWAEPEYMDFLRIPQEQQPLLINPPAPDSARDDPAGPWPIVATLERSVNGASQRVVVVGCQRWMKSEVMGAETEVEGRRVPTYPGNIELLDACVYWLAGQDGMISTSPQSRQVPLIPPMSEGTLGALRWALIGGLPTLILLIGAVWRLVRG